MAKINTPPCSLGTVFHILQKVYVTAVNSGVPLKTLLAPLLISQPGIGKSQGIKEYLAPAIAEGTGRTVEVRELRLGECGLYELTGLMTYDPVTKKCVYSKPDLYEEPEDDQAIVICFFDEVDKANPQMQGAALNLVHQKRFFVHRLPENSIVIAAGNYEQIDGESYSRLKAELNNRFCHFYIQPDYEEWKSWALEHDVHPMILAFLDRNQHLLYDADGGENRCIFYTPRTWMFLSDFLNTHYPDGKIDWSEAFVVASGLIGVETALPFQSFCEKGSLMPTMEDIISGKDVEVPTRTDLKDATLKSLEVYLLSHKDCLSAAEMKAVSDYVDQFPVDLALCFYRNLEQQQQLRELIYSLRKQEQKEFLNKYGKYI